MTAFVRPDSLDGVIEALQSDEDAHLLAGGVSMVLFMGSGLMVPSTLVSLDAVDALTGIEVQDDGLDIGARATHHDLTTHPVLRDRLPAAAELFSLIGNVRVRMAGTIGGNLAHADPAQDPAVLLSVLGAHVRVRGPEGERAIAIDDLADGPFSPTLEHGEIITRVWVPWLQPGSAATYEKFLAGTRDDYATVSVACRLARDGAGEVTSAALAAGAVGPTVIVLDAAARALEGTRPDAEVLAEVERLVAEQVEPHPDRRGSSDYKRQMTAVAAGRAVHRALAESTD